MLRRSSLVECVSVLPGNRCLQNVEYFFFYFGYFKQENLHKGDTKPKTVRLENLTYENALEILSRALNVKTLLGEVNL